MALRPHPARKYKTVPRRVFTWMLGALAVVYGSHAILNATKYYYVRKAESIRWPPGLRGSSYWNAIKPSEKIRRFSDSSVF